jgi:hypothetical protein
MDNRNEYLLFNQPLHSRDQYATAHQLAGNLQLVEADKPTPPDEQVKVLDRLSRQEPRK